MVVYESFTLKKSRGFGEEHQSYKYGGGSIKEQGTIYTSPYMEKARRWSVLWCAWPPQIFSVFTQFRPSPPQFSGVFTQFCRLRLKNLISIGDRITGLFLCMRPPLFRIPIWNFENRYIHIAD